jgi:hypothetical protein
MNSYADGVVKIYETANSAQPGDKPKVALTLKETLRFASRNFGYNRQYAALQAGVHVARVIRVPYRPTVTSLDVAETPEGTFYRIESAVEVRNAGEVPSLDLTLARAEWTPTHD